MANIRNKLMSILPHPRLFIAQVLSVLISLQARIDRGGLSRKVGRKIDSIFHRYKASKDAAGLFFYVGLFIPLLVVLILTIWPNRLSIILLYFNRDTFNSIISDLIVVPLSLVGLVIPFFVLVIEVVLSKFGFGTIKYSFQKSGIKRVIYIALSLLAVEILCLTSIRSIISVHGSGSGSHPFFYTTIVLSLSWATILLIFIAGRVILNVLNTFRIEIALGLYKKELIGTGMRELRKECTVNLSYKMLSDLLKDSPLSVSYFTPEGRTLIPSKRLGVITNVNITALRRLQWLLKDFLKLDSFRIQLASPFHIIEKGNLQIATVILPLENNQKLEKIVSRVIQASIKVSKQREEGDNLLEAFEAYKELILSLALQNNDALLTKALESYSDFFSAYINLGIRLNAEDAPRYSFSDWRAITLITHNLGELIEQVIEGANRGSIGTIAYWMREEMERCMEKGDEYIFSRLLNEFRTISYFSAKKGHTIGLNRSYFEPLQIFDFKLFRFGETEKITSSMVEYHAKLGNLIIRHLFLLLKDAVDTSDFNRFREMLSKLTPGQLFASFHPDLPFDKWESIGLLKDTQLSPNERAENEDRIKSHQIIEDFKTNYSITFNASGHAAISYLLETKYPTFDINNELTQIINSLWADLGTIHQTVEWIDNYDLREKVLGGLWEYWPDSRGVTSKDPLHFPLTVLVLRGLRAQSTETIALALPASRTINDFYEKIIQITKDVIENQQLVKFTGTITQETKTKWLTALEDSRQNYLETVSRAIQEAQIEPTLVDKFKTNIIEAYEENGLFKWLVYEQDIQDSVVEHPITINKEGYPPKESFINQNRVHYGEYGKADGQSIAHEIDTKVLGALEAQSEQMLAIPIASRLAAALDAAITKLQARTGSLVVMFISGIYDFQDAFYNLEGFIPGHQLGDRYRRGLFGEYRHVPIYMTRDEGIKGLLVTDIGLLSLKEEVINIQVREVNESERLALIAANPGFTDGKARERVKVSINFSLLLTHGHTIQSVRITPQEPVVEVTPEPVAAEMQGS